MATGHDGPTGDWFGNSEQISRLPGKVFAATCLAATLFGIVMVAGLLVYVTKDAIRPLTANPGWFLVFFLTLVVPSTALLAYFGRRRDGEATVALTALGIPFFGLLLGSGVLMLFIDVIGIFEWLAFVAATIVAVGVILGHRRVRGRTSFLEELLVGVVALVGLGPVTYQFISTFPTLPQAWLIYLFTFGLGGAAIAGLLVARRRNDRRAGLTAFTALFVTVTAGVFIDPSTGITPPVWVILFTFAAIPTALYAEGVVRRRQGSLPVGLFFPFVVVAGMLVGAVLVDLLGFAGPQAWLDIQFLTSANSRFPEEAGIYPALIGSILMMVVVAISSFPIGVGAALYLEEYAPSSGPLSVVVKFIEINIANLAGVPSVVYGLLGLALFVNWLDFASGIVVVGGMTVGLLILPIIIISAQEAIRAVPGSLRQASYGMGATRWQTIRRVVLPEALPGILTGSILAFGRAIGETAPLLMIGAAASVFRAPNGFFDIFSAMPRQIYTWVGQPSQEFQYGVMAAGVVTLVTVMISMNAAAILIRNKYERRS
ncbi:phosphate ABC transporter permease [Haloprofundus marisrubri]|uniref:Phosphate transport system permease protein PstA n=1 Tax=Haloprofundus marisrubri TaxID=1514971 RepID=A0A0W1R7X7_9EURY|nr:phosphate ABC transporter permease PstA [Haloprofundus marisrubri]KTG09313.1 phosphate ABC transporter permease [Haloprofundus marisrubri]